MAETADETLLDTFGETSSFEHEKGLLASLILFGEILTAERLPSFSLYAIFVIFAISPILF